MKENKKPLEELLVVGSNNECTTDPEDKTKPLVIRGVIKKHHAEQCIKDNRDFYYIDTGYFGNFPSIGNPGGKKVYHRIVKNENQLSTLKNVSSDRWDKVVKDDPRLKWSGWKDYNKKILLVMPNPKACKWYNVDYDAWIENTKTEITKYIDLSIEVRIKGSRVYRNREYSIYDAFDSGVYATVTMNSMAALESVLYGIPAFVTVPCAATPLSSTDLSQLASPFKPDEDLIYNHACNLAYGQFTLEEIENGAAWKIIKNS